MRKKIRKILTTIFILFVVASFAIVTVIVIIIAQGGKVTPDGIEKTGIIKLNVQPDKNLKVYVDDKLVSINDSKIENLNTGIHNLRIEKENYTNWTKDVEVEEGIVSEIWAFLFPIELKLKQMTSTGIERAFYSPDGSYVVYIVKNSNSNNNGIWKLKLTQSTFGLVENKPEKISSLNSKLTETLNSEYSVSISPNNERFLLQTDKEQLIYTMNGSDVPINLIEVTNLGLMADKLTWFRQGDSLIAEKNKSIYEYNISDNTTQFIYSFPNSPLYTVNGRTLIFNTDHKYYSYSNKEKTLLDISKTVTLPEPSNIWLSHNSDEILYVKSDEQLYYVNTKKTILPIGEFDIVEISPNGTAAIIEDNQNKLYVFRSEYIAPKDSFTTSIKLINETFSSENTSYIWSSDSLQIIENQKTSAGIEGGNTSSNVITIIDKYGENKHVILKTAHIINNDCYLANNSRDFVVLLRDSNNKGNNLYMINLID